MDGMNFYFRSEHADLMKELIGLDAVEEHLGGIYVVHADAGRYARATKPQINGKRAAVGKLRHWNIKDSQTFVGYIHIDHHPVFTEGIIITPYQEHEVKYHLGGRTIDEVTGVHRVEFGSYNPFGESQAGPIKDGFDVYDHRIPGDVPLLIASTPKVERRIGLHERAA